MQQAKAGFAAAIVVESPELPKARVLAADSAVREQPPEMANIKIYIKIA